MILWMASCSRGRIEKYEDGSDLLPGFSRGCFRLLTCSPVVQHYKILLTRDRKPWLSRYLLQCQSLPLCCCKPVRARLHRVLRGMLCGVGKWTRISEMLSGSSLEEIEVLAVERVISKHLCLSPLSLPPT